MTWAQAFNNVGIAVVIGIAVCFVWWKYVNFFKE